MSFITVVDSEMMEEIEEGCGDWEIVEEGKWVQDYKYQHKESVVKHVPTGKYYQYEISRSGSPFTDWYYSYVHYAINNNLIEIKNNIFQPNTPITREELVAILYKYIQK